MVLVKMTINASLFSLILISSCVYVNSFDIFGIGTIYKFISNVNYIYNNIDRNYSSSVPEDAKLNIMQLANKYGYDLEEHTVTTEDDYILKLHRIPGGRNVTRNGAVVFLMHGILDSSDTWILQGPDRALGYILADEGFDVWMGNARGNKHSMFHKTLNHKEPQFWEFTWEEIGVYDTTAMIDYITEITKQNVYYVGHSQGTTAFYVMTSLKPLYNEKVNMMFSLAPAAWLSQTRSPLLRLLKFNAIFAIFKSFFQEPFNANFLNTSTCVNFHNQCYEIVNMLTGSNSKFVNASMFPVIFGHLPDSSSTLQFFHYAQLVNSGNFHRFDFGAYENYNEYGQVSPPNYDLSKISVPIVLIYSNNDMICDEADVSQLSDHLPNVYGSHLVDGFNHIDFLYANVAKDVVYATIVKDILDFESNRTTV